MTDERLARLRAHDNNISRYQRLLRTNLSDLERRFLEQRLGEERSARRELGPTCSRPADGIADPLGVGALYQQNRYGSDSHQ